MMGLSPVWVLGSSHTVNSNGSLDLEATIGSATTSRLEIRFGEMFALWPSLCLPYADCEGRPTSEPTGLFSGLTNRIC